MARRRKPAWSEFDRRTAEIDRELAETDRILKETLRAVGDLTNGWGRFVEALVRPAIPICFAELGYDVYSDGPCARRKGGEEMQIDVLALARHSSRGEVTLVVEVKSRLQRATVDELLLEKLPHFLEFFPEYHDRRVEGVVAGIRIDEGVTRYAIEAGLFVFVPSGETVRIANPSPFEPRAFLAR